MVNNNAKEICCFFAQFRHNTKRLKYKNSVCIIRYLCYARLNTVRYGAEKFNCLLFVHFYWEKFSPGFLQAKTLPIFCSKMLQNFNSFRDYKVINNTRENMSGNFLITLPSPCYEWTCTVQTIYICWGCLILDNASGTLCITWEWAGASKAPRSVWNQTCPLKLRLPNLIL